MAARTRGFAIKQEGKWSVSARSAHPRASSGQGTPPTRLGSVNVVTENVFRGNRDAYAALRNNTVPRGFYGHHSCGWELKSVDCYFWLAHNTFSYLGAANRVN